MMQGAKMTTNKSEYKTWYSICLLAAIIFATSQGLDMTGSKSVVWGGVLSDKAALGRAIIQVLSCLAYYFH